MTESLRVIRIFIGSPGGLDTERQAARDAVDKVNQAHSEKWGVFFKIVGWELTIPGYVRPQSKINDDLDKCEYFIGVLWNKWGSRPSTDPLGPTSGFEEEYLRAEKRIIDGKMKDMALFFKHVEVPEGFEPSGDMKTVIDFKTKCITEKKVFFKHFNTEVDFKDAIVDKLQEIGWSETAILQRTSDDLIISEQRPAVQSADVDALQGDEEMLFGQRARDFLKDFITKPNTLETLQPEEVARLRLIACSVKRDGNSDSYLGNHDANIVFTSLRDSDFSEREIAALIDGGVNGFHSQNIPLWGWLIKLSSDYGINRLWTLATLGTDLEKQNALWVLRLAQKPPQTKVEGETQHFIQTLIVKSSARVFESAIQFLLVTGSKELIPFLTNVDMPIERRDKVHNVIGMILARSDKSAALRWLIEKSVDKIEDELRDVLFVEPSIFTTELIRLCVDARCEFLRLRAVEILFERGELDLDTAESLLADTSYDIRVLAVEVIGKSNKTFDENIVATSLKLTRPGSGLLSSSNDRYFKKYQENRLVELSYDELREVHSKARPYDSQALNILYRKFAKRCAPEIRANLHDGYDSFVSQRVGDDLKTALNDGSGLWDTARLVYVNIAIESLCSLRDQKDISLVRTVLDENNVEATPAIARYLGKFGNWSDIDRILSLGENTKNTATFRSSTTIPEEKAQAILDIGNGRIADILALSLDNSVKVWIAKLLPRKIMEQLSNEAIAKELQAPHDEYRRTFALKSLTTLRKNRIEQILKIYTSGSKSFYNVIHWLDLGVSFPAPDVKKIALNGLASF